MYYLLFLFSSFSIESIPLQDPHFRPRTSFAICKVESLPRSNQTQLISSPQKIKIFFFIFFGSKENQDFQNPKQFSTPLDSNRSSKISNENSKNIFNELKSIKRKRIKKCWLRNSKLKICVKQQENKKMVMLELSF